MSFKDSIGYLLHEIAHQIDAESDQVLSRQLGIGFAQFKILMVLEEYEGVTQKNIAQRLGQSEPSISRQIKILQNKGLVRNRISTTNRRQHIITLTPKGLQVFASAALALNHYHQPMFERLSEKQQIKIAEALALIKATITR